MIKCNRPDWSDEHNDYCDCDHPEFEDLPTEVKLVCCESCKWYWDWEEER